MDGTELFKRFRVQIGSKIGPMGPRVQGSTPLYIERGGPGPIKWTPKQKDILDPIF